MQPEGGLVSFTEQYEVAIHIRSPSKVNGHIKIMQHGNGRCAIVSVVRSDRGKAFGGAIGQILILDTCIHESGVFLRAKKEDTLHPSTPPFPVPKKRPVQSRGNQASKVMLDRFDVGMLNAIRHISDETT